MSSNIERKIRIMQQKKRQQEKRKAIARKVAGYTMFVTFMLVIGKAGSSDLGVAWESVFPSVIVYMALFAVAFLVFSYCEKC